MSALALNPAPLTMSSLEIAQLVESRHDSVKRTMERLANQGVIRFTPTVETSHEGAGARPVEVYLVNKRDSYVVVAQLSPEFTARLVDRWQELEAGAAPALNLRDPKQLAAAALQLIEVNQELQAKVDEQQRKIDTDAPKVEGFDRIASSDGSLCLTDAAKTLQVQPRRFTQLLQEKHWVYRRPMGSGWLAYQDRIQAGLMEHKVTTGEKSDGTEWSNTQVRVTAKGLTRLAEVVRQAGLH